MSATNQLQLPAQKGRHRPRQRHGQDANESKGNASRVLSIPSSGNSSLYIPLPDEHQNLKVQESDGNFFENFTALSWRQENKRLRATNEVDRDSTKPPPLETQFVQKSKLPELSRKEFELLYVEVLYTIKHKIGTTIGGHLPFIQDLYQYAQEAFKVSPEDHARLLAQATKEKPPIVILNATVLQARNLEAKDADGFSDPYCMLGIMPGRRMEHEGSTEGGSLGSSDEENCSRPREKEKGGLRKFSLRKKSTALRDLLPAKYIQTTSVIPNTLNPVWNDKFRFDLEDVQTDHLHLDIWDHDDEFSVIEAAKKLNEVQGIKGLGRYFKQVAQSARTKKSSGNSVDDFLGCINIPLDDIPSSGHEKWYQLEGRTPKSNVEGQIKLRLALATREDRGIPEDDNWTDVRQHEDLISIFIEHEVRKCKEGSYRWSGELPQAAQTIIHQHAVQGDVTPVQQAVCRWMAYSRKHLDHPLDYILLLSLLQELDKLWEPTSLSREEEECLAESFTRFINHCLSLIRKQRDVFPVNNRQAMLRLDGMLQCLHEIYTMNVFRRTCPFQKELHPEIANVVKKSTLEWYDRSHRRCRQHTHVDMEEDVIQGLLELTNQLNTDLHHAVTFYTKLYEEIVGVQYFRITYQVLEKMFGDEVNSDLQMTLSRLEMVDKEESDRPSVVITMGTQLFELYLALQEFCKFKEHLPNSIKKELSICQYYQWFRFAVQKWLQIAKQKAYKRIHKAVELDKTVDVKSGVKYSTSAVDVCCCFSQMTEFWKNLDWPDLIDGLPLVRQLTEDVCGGAVLYADLMHEKLRRAGYYDEEGQFDVTEQLCITINNIEQVRKSLSPMPEMLQFNEILTALDGHSAKNRSKYDLSKILAKADAQMVQKIKHVVDRVADKMRPDIKKDVFHLNWAPDAVPADDAIGDLLEYLDNNLLTLNTHLLKTNFDRILESIWTECLEEFREALETEEAKQAIFYQRMYDAIGLLVQFFNANDKGLPMQNILSPQYQASGNKGKAAYRGRSYQCRRCLKVDRKGRTVAHILKHHVPFDQVPYSCSLCSFRCLDKDTLVSHINQYKRHREEVRKAGGKVDHSKVLHRSSNPKIIGNDDMVLLTREDSGKRFTRQEDPLNQDDQDSIFEDDEDDCDALSLPAWAKGDTPSSPLDVLYRATPLTTSGATVSYQDQFPAFSGSHLVQQTLPHSSAWAMTTATTETVTNPVIHSSIHQVLTTPPHPLSMNQASPWAMVTTATSTRPTVISHTVDTRQQFVPQSSSFQHPTIPTCTTINLQDLYPQNETKSSTLGQFRVNKIFNTGLVNQPTPLMDEPERESPAFEDILPSLMHAASESDPLMLEIQTEKSRTSEKRGSEVQEGESKKMKGEDQIPHSCPPVDLSPIVKAIDRATKEIVDAIDRGSRALRCHDQSLLKVVSSLGRIERVLEKRRESGRSPSREVRRDRDRETDKENSKPVLKSTQLKSELSLHKMDTYGLIEKFYQEKLEEQRQWTSTEFGTLSVRVWYKRDSHTMLVEVLSAKDVIPLDANGLSDPYVVVSFCPEHMFSTVPTQTTKIVKKTLNPEFDESFEFNVSLQQCQRKGAALVFTVMDHDYVFQNDFAGEVFMPLSEIPGVDGDEVTGYEALSVVTLPLMQPGKKKTGALAVLAKRDWDRAAQDFVKLRTKVQEQSS